MLWNAATGQVSATLKGHWSLVTSVAFSPDGWRIATSSQDGTVKVWDTETGQEIETLQGHRRWANGVAFSPDGQRIASAGDEAINIWRMAGTGFALPMSGALSITVTNPGENSTATAASTDTQIPTPTSTVGTPEYIAEQITLQLSVGKTGGLEESISSRCKGLLADVRDGKVTSVQVDDARKLFTELGAFSKPITAGGITFLSVRDGEGTTITFRLTKSRGKYEVIEMTVADSPLKKSN